MICILIAIALSLFKIHDSIFTPCSVKQKCAYRKPFLSSLEVTFCDLQFAKVGGINFLIKKFINRVGR